MVKNKMTKAKKMGRVHCMIPDCQIKPDSPTDHLVWIGKYIAEIKPDVIINIGDFCDAPSLSYYDKGKLAMEGRRVQDDIDAANLANLLLTSQWAKVKGYKPEMHLTLGNHEHRITRYVECNPQLEGFLSVDDLNYKQTGWTVHPFLKQVVIDGVAYAHFFANPNTGKPYCGENLMLRLKNIGYSFSMGHQQGLYTAIRALGNGRIMRGLVHGVCYLEDEIYKGSQGNTDKRGIIIKHEVFDGDYDIMEVSLDYLCRRYEGKPVYKFMQDKYPDIFNSSEWLNRQANRR